MTSLRSRWYGLLGTVSLLFGVTATAYGQVKEEKPAPVQKETARVQAAEVLYLLADVNAQASSASIITEQALAKWTGAYGLNVAPADATLREQLQLPAGEALVIVGIAQENQAEKHSLRQHDVILGMGSAPDPTKPVTLTLYRQGKSQKLDLPAAIAPKALWIGVDMEAIEEKAPLRSQLNLPANAGLLLTNIYPESPAAKAGLQVHDVVIARSDTLLKSTDDLAAAVQQSEKKPLSLRLFRQSKPMTIQVTPQVRPQPLQYSFEIKPDLNNVWHLITTDRTFHVNDTADKYLQLQMSPLVSRLRLAYSAKPANEASPVTMMQQLEALQQEVAAMQQHTIALQERIATLLKNVSKDEKK